MTLTEMFEMVSVGRFYQPQGEFLWTCPVCQAQTETSCEKERDRMALEHCMSHHTVGVRGMRGVDLRLQDLQNAWRFRRTFQPSEIRTMEDRVPVLAAG